MSTPAENQQYFWYVNEMQSQMTCLDKIEFGLISSSILVNDVENTNYIIYSKQHLTHLFKPIQFSRVTVARTNKCANRGVAGANDECQCRPGFGGSTCDLACPGGRFGTKCEFICPNENCAGFLICAPDPIGCQCGSGLEKYKSCTKACGNNRWGPDCAFNCSHCETSNKLFILIYLL